MSVLGRVAEFQNVMADLYLQQAEVSKYWTLIGPDVNPISEGGADSAPPYEISLQIRLFGGQDLPNSLTFPKYV